MAEDNGNGKELVGSGLEPLLAKMKALLDHSNDPVRDMKIVAKRLGGNSMKKIADQLRAEGGRGSLRTVNRVLKRDDVKALIDLEYLRMAAVVPSATDNVIAAALSLTSDLPLDDTEKKIAWEANKLIMQAHGLLPSNHISIVHQTYIANQTTNLIPPFIAELAKRHFGAVGGGIENAIDVEVVKEEE